jgi:GNAT superfamily N-acetyltransferase
VSDASVPRRFAVRDAVPDDAPALWAIHVRAIRHLAAPHYPQDVLAAWTARSSPASFAEPIVANRVVVALDETSQPCGYGELAIDEGVIRAVYVDPDYARRGVGRAVVRALEQRAGAAEIATLSLDATRNAVPFYRALGYRSAGTVHHPLPPGLVLECEVMEKSLR